MKTKNTMLVMGLGAATALGLTFLMTNKNAKITTKKMMNNVKDEIENKCNDFM